MKYPHTHSCSSRRSIHKTEIPSGNLCSFCFLCGKEFNVFTLESHECSAVPEKLQLIKTDDNPNDYAGNNLSIESFSRITPTGGSDDDIIISECAEANNDLAATTDAPNLSESAEVLVIDDDDVNTSEATKDDSQSGIKKNDVAKNNSTLNLNDVAKTLKNVHNFKYICHVCSAEFQTGNELQVHIKTHFSNLKCGECQELFETPYDFGVHSAKHNEERKIKCPFCTYVSKSFSRYNFKLHLNYAHLKKFPYFCKECGKGFKQYKVYQEHQNLHSGKKPYICVVCSKSFAFEKYLPEHQTRHHQVSSTGDGYANACKKCHRVYKSLTRLSAHTEACSNKKYLPNPFTCSWCDKKFSVKCNLKIHERMHTGEKPYSCKFCGKCFALHGHFNIHIRSHTGERPYKCNFCNKDFTSSTVRNIHERVHTGEKPYSCEFCGKCFAFHGHFKVHIRSHTGERPYKCDFCHKGFAKNDGRKKHQRICTKNQLKC